jgi:hypothetical protein
MYIYFTTVFIYGWKFVEQLLVNNSAILLVPLFFLPIQPILVCSKLLFGDWKLIDLSLNSSAVHFCDIFILFLSPSVSLKFSKPVAGVHTSIGNCCLLPALHKLCSICGWKFVEHFFLNNSAILLVLFSSATYSLQGYSICSKISFGDWLLIGLSLDSSATFW